MSAPPRAGYPFDIEALAGVAQIDLTSPVTILVGENGSGKSTFLEALAIAARLPAIGSAAAHDDPTLTAQAALAKTLRLSWSTRRHRGFFLRAEDVFGFILALRRERELLESEMADAAVRLADASDHARALGLGPYRASLGEMRRRYGDDPDARSHGETFLHLFRERFVPDGLFLLDEPEAALSPQSQLALISMIGEAVLEGGQFVIATHSPLLQAIPGAVRRSFDGPGLPEVEWESLESVQLWRSVLDAPERLMRHLWPSEPPA